nr:immunoglobulin heavy chain junction region [Mus musculus]
CANREYGNYAAWFAYW